jgi:hypothetical protein
MLPETAFPNVVDNGRREKLLAFGKLHDRLEFAEQFQVGGGDGSGGTIRG